MNSNEQHLIRLLQQGDHVAFDTLYNTYSGRIYGRILRLTAIESVASDILQETFVTVWEKRQSINVELSFRSWLYRIAENAVYQYYRRLARDSRFQERVLNHFTEMYWHTEEDLIFKESKKILHDAIAKLPEQRRKVFQLCKIEGYSYREAAEILGVSPSTVSNQLVKANAFVKEYIFKSQEMALVILTAFLMSR